MQTMSNPQKSQSAKFKEAAKEHEADEDESRWEERLKKAAKQKTTHDHGNHGRSSG